MTETNYTISQIAKIVNGRLIAPSNSEITINELLIDSRKLVSTENCMFFALKTKRNDGHKYIGNLYQAGLRNFMVSQLPDEVEEYPGSNFIVFADTLKALQKLAANHRAQMKYPVIGITGSNGKTVVKEWLFQVLQNDMRVYRSPKSYNSQVGVPLSVWQMNPNYDLAILEAGISEPNEMENLQKIIQPTIGIFTNVGEAHGENFINKTHKAGEKLKLFTKVKTLIYSLDQDHIQEVLIRSELLEDVKAFTWSMHQFADLRIERIQRQSFQSEIFALYKNEHISITIPFSDEASIENAIQVWCLLLLLNYSHADISDRFLQLNPVAMRLELKNGINNCSIINDSYNSDINSIKIALDFLQQQNQHTKNTVILSDIFQSGKNEPDLYEEIAELIAKNNIDRFIGIGRAIRKYSDKFSVSKKFYETTSDFLKNINLNDFKNENILLKGARYYEFEQISKILQQKSHQTVLEINLDHMVANLNYFRSKLNPQTKVMLMVKAFSYGSGSFEIANLMQYHHADYLTVAYADEGVELRKAGITLPIMVMSPDEDSMDTIIKHDLEPEIYSFKIWNELEKSIRKHQKDSFPVKIHIKLDTGMKRLGFEEKDLPELKNRISSSELIKVQSVFSHLASSDNATSSEFTHLQFQRFMAMSIEIEAVCGGQVLKHILNSAGITKYPEYQLDMVRLGLGLYGFSPFAEEEEKLKNIHKLKTSITQIKHISTGESVGYDQAFVATEDMKIATIAIGYADGIHRYLGNGQYSMLIHGKAAPVIGKICMDMLMLNINDIDCIEGDEVIVFENQQHIKQMASIGNTIPYEILTGISQRVKRVYFKE